MGTLLYFQSHVTEISLYHTAAIVAKGTLSRAWLFEERRARQGQQSRRGFMTEMS